MTENDAFDADYHHQHKTTTTTTAPIIRGREKRAFSWSIEPEMHPDLLEVFRENGRQSLLNDDEELNSSTENLREIVEINSRTDSRYD